MTTGCIKTGFYAFAELHKQYLYGDAFLIEGGSLLLRICAVGKHPINGSQLKHFTIRNWTLWFDEEQTSMKRNSTMVCDPGDWSSHGYDGEPL